MTAPTNTFQTYQAKGIRENLANVIYNISPADTPFVSNAGKETVSNTYFEWQVDSLAATDSTNAAIEGDDPTIQTSNPTSRVGNYTQISVKTVIVSGTLEAVDKAGRRSELAYQLAKRSKELKRDMEVIACSNQAGNAGSSSSARKTAGFETWLTTNTFRGAGGANPTLSGTTSGYPNAGATDGTQRSFTETLVKSMVKSVYVNSVTQPPILMVGPANKQQVSTFAGIAVNRYQITSPKPGAVIGAADVYVSDFGEISIVPNRFQRERTAFGFNPEYASIVTLRNFQQLELAKTGDSEKRELLVEWGVKIMNEAAHGVVADLNTSY
jgi:hypothetical protein